ncbi:MAG: hypothetical protein GC206_05410 [Alphaproteobacteria bacterium]|nr:hypothetical protein [Alphaproteobacteria bacterium]
MEAGARRAMVNAVILHCPGDEERARWLAQAWRNEGRATLCAMGANRRRIALGARSALIGLWSSRSLCDDGGRQFAHVLAESADQAMLVVFDGRPPLDIVTQAGVTVVVAHGDMSELLGRLRNTAGELADGRAQFSDLGGRKQVRAAPARKGGVSTRTWGVVAGIVLGLALAIGGLAPSIGRIMQTATADAEQR